MAHLRSLALLLLLTGFGCGVSPPASRPQAVLVEETVPAAPPGVRVENPRYLRWVKHKVGTTVSVREKTVTPTVATETTTTYKLKSVTDDGVVVEVAGDIASPDGARIPAPAQDVVYARWATVPADRAGADLSRPEGTVDQRDDKVALLGREYNAKWYRSKGRVEAGPTETETWLVDELPGGLARSVHTIPAIQKTVSSEVVRIRAE